MLAVHAPMVGVESRYAGRLSEGTVRGEANSRGDHRCPIPDGLEKARMQKVSSGAREEAAMTEPKRPTWQDTFRATMEGGPIATDNLMSWISYADLLEKQIAVLAATGGDAVAWQILQPDGRCLHGAGDAIDVFPTAETAQNNLLHRVDGSYIRKLYAADSELTPLHPDTSCCILYGHGR